MESPFQGSGVVQPHLSHPNPYPASQELVIGQNAGMMPAVVQEGQTVMDTTSGMSQADMEEQKRNNLNIAIICRMGQETVQEILTKTSELFTLLKSMQLPNGTVQSINSQEEKKLKLQDFLKTISLGFRKLRRICEKCNYNAVTMEYTHIEVDSLIPLKDEIDSRQEDRKPTDIVKACSLEYQELIELVMLKNRQLKEVIDNLRTFIWDINTMLCMRKP
ncbi:mediator of RNA polymerase II transcription subunit 30 [Parasteatoda tepidariorum]|uniref:mediator of RNA polymerase II transcription subunit 30 n=1 Tax=Parasteatoda tepidariorum TaxID=114398 RepID=UPI00077FAF51|nr:mediator of RNA polymerase II transcription subunit 30 [Parasteatoda tepidariorum]